MIGGKEMVVSSMTGVSREQRDLTKGVPRTEVRDLSRSLRKPILVDPRDGSAHAGLRWVVMEVFMSQVRTWNAPRVQAGMVRSGEGHEEGMAIWRASILTEDNGKLALQAQCCQDLLFP